MTPIVAIITRIAHGRREGRDAVVLGHTERNADGEDQRQGPEDRVAGGPHDLQDDAYDRR
jgi:hypothetical protein